MIDKLDLRIPNGCVLRPDVQEYISGIPYETYPARVRPAAHYTGKADLRSIGLDAILHVQCKHGDNHHKLELLDVGKKQYSEIVGLVESVTFAQLERLGIMRIDLTADLADVSVPWFKSHVRFKYKRTENEYGQLRYGLIGHGKVETIMCGTRPNVFRIYNKTEESLYQFRRMQRKASKDADALEFEKEFGIKETDTLTRIERQCGGGRIPPELATFGNLHQAPTFNPFSAVEIVTSGHFNLPAPEDCDGLEYFTGLGMHQESRRVGMQEFRKSLNKQTRGNAARTIERYARFFPDETDSPVSGKQIYETYRKSLIAQLAA